MTLGPPERFMRILISLLIFFFLTGLSTLTTTFWDVESETPAKTWEGGAAEDVVGEMTGMRTREVEISIWSTRSEEKERQEGRRKEGTRRRAQPELKEEEGRVERTSEYFPRPTLRTIS